jgi:hypothetical protein
MAAQWDCHWVVTGGSAQAELVAQGYQLNLTEKRHGKSWARMCKQVAGPPVVARGDLYVNGDGVAEPFPGSCELRDCTREEGY